MAHRQTDEHKQKIAEAVAASWTPERRKELSEERTGEANPFHGKTHTKEAKAAISEAMSGPENPFFGKSHSAETVALISKRLKGKSNGSIPRLAKYGVTVEQYRKEMDAGNSWCCYKKHFAPLTEFGRFAARAAKNGPGGLCRTCEAIYRRNLLLKKRYGVEPEWYEKKLAEQNGGCAICKTELTLNRKSFLAIDHCHKTMNVRGILCARCNLSLARFECVPGWAEKAVAYLRMYGTEPA